MHMAITQAVIRKYPTYYEPEYRYIDLTAGKGKTPDGNLGSPIVFLDKASDPKFTTPFHADFIEREKENISELYYIIVRVIKWYLVDGDNDNDEDEGEGEGL